MPAPFSQLLVLRASGYAWDHQRQYPQWELANQSLRSHLQAGVSGVILVGGSITEVAARTQQLQSWAPQPLLLAADVEEGVGQWFPGGTRFPPPMALTAARPELAVAMGQITALEARALGLNWLLAPVGDINRNPQNPVINVRAFGETPGEAIAGSRAFLWGAQSVPGMLTTTKHFPGHGDTVVDSHLAVPTVAGDLDFWRQGDALPFRFALEAGVDAVMTAHVVVPQVDEEVATCSRRWLTDVLRGELGFKGLIVSDALMMGGITRRYAADVAAVKALQAGVDLLLMPVDADGAIAAIGQAVAAGALSMKRLEASLERIDRARQKTQRGPSISLEQVDFGGHRHCAQEIAAASWHMSRQTPTGPIAIQLAIADHLPLTDPLLRLPAVDVLTVQRQTLPFLRGDRLENVWVQIFSRGNPFTPSGDCVTPWLEFLQDLGDRGQLRGIAFYGSPYLRDHLLPHLPPGLPWYFSYSQLGDAQALILSHLQDCLTRTNPLPSA
jgi:beta-glucosidase